MEFVNSRGTVSDELMRKWFVQIVQALRYTHQKGLVHKDIKVWISSEQSLLLLLTARPRSSTISCLMAIECCSPIGAMHMSGALATRASAMQAPRAIGRLR